MAKQLAEGSHRFCPKTLKAPDLESGLESGLVQDPTIRGLFSLVIQFYETSLQHILKTSSW